MLAGKNTKRKWLRQLLIGVAVSISLLVLIAFVFEKAIGRRVLTEVNANLTTELKVKSISLSLIRSFPNVALDMRSATLTGTDGKPMFNAAHLQFEFGLFSLFSKKIEIKSIIVEKGAVLLKVNKNGKANYDITKPSESDEKNDVAFELKKAILKDFTIGYENLQDAQNIGLTLDDAAFKGAFSSKNFELKSSAYLVSHGISLGQTSFLENNKIDYTTAIKVDLGKNRYEIKQFELGIEKNRFDVTGVFQKGKNSSQVNIDFVGKKCDLSSLLQLLPSQYRQNFAGFESDGNIVATASVKGTLSKTQNPAISAAMELKNGSLKSEKLSESLANVSFTAAFDNGAAQNAANSTFLIPNFKGYFGQQEINMKFGVKNLDLPFIDFYLDGKIPLQAVHGLVFEKSNQGNGTIALRDISAQGYLDDMKSINGVKKVKMSGNIQAEQVILGFAQGQMSIPTGNIKFDNNNVTISDLNLLGLENDITLNGNVSNFLPVFLKDSSSQNAKLDFSANLNAEKINLDKLLAATSSSEKKSNTNTTTSQNTDNQPFYKNLQGTFQSNIKDLTYQRFRVKNFIGTLNFEDEVIGINGNVETMGGTMAMKSRLSLHGTPDMHGNLVCNQIDAKTFFYQFENFGQTVLTDKNLDGKLDARIVFDAKWDKKGNFLAKDLITFAYLNIQNGELKGVKMLEDFSTFVKIQDLHNIKFTNLENWFEIREGQTYMPMMELRNNALNLSVCGNHSFENDINYCIKVNAAQVIVNRFKKFNPRLSPQKDIEDDGFFDLFFNMKGNLDNYEIDQAKTYVKGEFERSLVRKREIQSKLDAALAGKDFQLREKMLFKPEKTAGKTKLNAVAIPKEKTPEKKFVLPKNYKPTKQKKDDLGNEFLEGF